MENYYKNKDVKKYCYGTDNPNHDLHHFEIKFRSVCVAPSGSGKSNFITNLIAVFCKNKGTYDNIYIFCKSVDEPLYRYLLEKSKGLIEVYEDLSKLPALNDLNACKQTLIIFDDTVTDLKKHPIISEYFICGRKKSCSIMFVSQSYYGTPKIIRQNINYLVVLKLGGTRDINSILRECSVDLTKDQLLKMYQNATKNNFDSFIINLDKSGNERYSSQHYIGCIRRAGCLLCFNKLCLK
jgi:hypothetical protein